MSGPAGQSEAQSVRDQAGRTFDQAIAQVGRRADALDTQWRSFKDACYQGRIVGSFDAQTADIHELGLLMTGGDGGADGSSTEAPGPS